MEDMFETKFYLILWCLIGTQTPVGISPASKFYLILWCLIGTERK